MDLHQWKLKKNILKRRINESRFNTQNDKCNKKYYMVKNTDTNRNKMWTLAEIKFLEKCFYEGKTDRYIASELKRTMKGVERMRHKMGLRKGE